MRTDSAVSPAAGKISLRLVRLDEADARLLLRWRNDPITRNASFDTAERDWIAFWPWFRDSYVRPDLPPPVIVEIDGTPAASIRFDKPRVARHTSSDAVEISIHVAPEVRRRRVGLEALALCRSYLAAQGRRTIVAIVKAENEASLRFFARAGYRRVGTDSVNMLSEAPPAEVVVFVQEPLDSAKGETTCG